ncbi:MAG: sigma-70 family RNA polymerase sigma factor [Planctomycetota bacterium]
MRRKGYHVRMHDADETCWTLIEDAAAGKAEGRDRFALHYAPVVKAYLLARWGRSDSKNLLDDAMQEVFLECFKHGGALEKVESRRRGGFRAFLYGVTRNVTRRFEEKSGRSKEVTLGSTLGESPQLADKDLERAFDRAWAMSIVRQSVDQQRESAAASGDEALKRLELLRLRFQEAKPIRDIATEWGEDAAILHREYAKARREFEDALQQVVAFHLPGEPADVARECQQLLALLES